MSLFTDLKEVLTPYAQRIKGLAAADDEINADLSTLDRKVDANDKKIKADLGNLTDLETENKNSIVSAINEVAGGGLSDEVKNSLLLCLRNVPYLSDNGAYELLSVALDGESDYRFITAADIESSVGYGNISVNNGTVTPETFVSFSILTYNADFIRFTTPENLAHARFVFKKDGTSYYIVNDGGTIMRFDKSGSKYEAVKNIDQTFATITKYNGFSYLENGKRYQLELDSENHIFRLLSISGVKLMEITNANIIGYWGDDSENLGKLWRFENARILKEDDYRFITLNDIENSLGYGNITISEGTVIPATFESFSIVTYNTTYIRFSVPDNYTAHPPARFVFKKDGTSYYIVNDGGTIMRFDKSGSKYEAVKNIDQTFATITKYNGFSYLENGKRYQLELDSENHIFRLLSISGVKLMEITNANIIGYWGDNSESLDKYWRFINTRTTNDD